MARIGAFWNWNKQWFTEGDWMATDFLEATLGIWHGNSRTAGNNRTIDEAGEAPVFRLQQRNLSGFAPYAEGALSFHLIPTTSIDANRKFGSSLQFSGRIGLRVRFGQCHEFDLGDRFQHLSNGGIKQPNHAVNFSQVRFACHF